MQRTINAALLELIQGDSVEQRVDAIVTATNPGLFGGGRALCPLGTDNYDAYRQARPKPARLKRNIGDPSTACLKPIADSDIKESLYATSRSVSDTVPTLS